MKTIEHHAAYLAMGVLAPVALALTCMTVPGIPAIAVGVAGIPVAIVAGVVQRSRTTSARAVLLAVCVAGGSSWSTVAAMVGISPMAVFVLVIGAVMATLIMAALPDPLTPEEIAAAAQIRAETTGRTRMHLALEAFLRKVGKQDITIEDIRPWDNPDNGMDIIVNLPDGMEPYELAVVASKLQSSQLLRLPPGCVVDVVDGEYQCEAILRVMLRNCLNDYVNVSEIETSDPASILDKFPITRSPTGSWFLVSLRIACMIVGGTTGSGKTTLLNRIIAFLARCTDALIWVVDFNGGGLGAQWMTAYDEGRVDRPVIDWLAPNAAESAVLLACAKRLGLSRKTNPECIRRRKKANSNVLPVGPDLPAVIVLTDEGGEIRKSVSVLAQIVCAQISSVAQLGREAGIRVVMSVLRGTADLLEKGLRAVCSIRICHRMDEKEEYAHVLGTNMARPPKLRDVGAGLIYETTQQVRPEICRSVDVDPDFIERHSIACAHLRPTLDDAGQRVCAGLTLYEVFMERDPDNFEDLLAHPALADVELGRAYTRRHERRREWMTSLEAEDALEDDFSKKRPSVPVRKHVPEGATARLLAYVGGPSPDEGSDGGRAEVASSVGGGLEVSGSGGPEGSAEEIESDSGHGPTLRERIIGLVTDVEPRGLRSGELEELFRSGGVPFSRGNLFVVLKSMVEKGQLLHPDDKYYLP